MDTTAKKEYWDLIDSLKAKVGKPAFLKSDDQIKDMALIRAQAQERLSHAVSLVQSSGFTRRHAARVAHVSVDRLRQALNGEDS